MSPLNRSGGRAMKDRKVYSSVEHMYDPTSTHGSSRYNPLFRRKPLGGEKMWNKPATSESRAFPSISTQKEPGKMTQLATSAKKSFRDQKFGIMSLSPFRNTEEFDTSHSRLVNENKHIIGREKDIAAEWRTSKQHTKPGFDKSAIYKEKVQFRKMNNATFTSFNSTGYKEPDDRYLYVIPEGSDVTSEYLSVVKVNLTEYVLMLLPKEHLVGTNAKLQRMGPYEKLQLAKPSKEMQNQVFRSIIQNLEAVIPK